MYGANDKSSSRRGGADYGPRTKQNRDDKVREERFSRIGKHRNGGADYKSCIKQNSDDKDRKEGFSRIRKHRRGGAGDKSTTKQNSDDKDREGRGKWIGIFLGIAAAAFICTQRQRGRPRQNISDH